MSLPPSWRNALDTTGVEEETVQNAFIQPPSTFCLCRKPDDGNKMIRCNDCKDWFHSQCVNLTHSQISKYEKMHKKWFCPPCLLKRHQEDRIPCPFSPFRTFKNEKTLETHLRKQHPNNTSLDPTMKNNVDALVEELVEAKAGRRILRRIPKGARFSVADKFTKIVDECIHLNSIEAWSNLLLFAYRTMHVETEQKKSLTTKIKENVNHVNQVNISSHSTPIKINFTPSMEQRVQTKIDDFDISGAVKILSSDAKLAPFDEATFRQLELKHPSSNKQIHVPSDFDQQILFTEAQVKKAINSFSSGSAPGMDGFRPQFLKDIISVSAGAAGQRALTSVTTLCNFLSTGKLNSQITPILYGASLCALSKKDGGLRPIAVGSVFRRLTAKLSCKNIQSDLQSYLWPNQLGVATKLGCESLIHAVRTYVNQDSNKEKVLLKILNEESLSFIDSIGATLIRESGDTKAKQYLYQRISLAIQRGNAASIRGTLPDSISMEEIHNL